MLEHDTNELEKRLPPQNDHKSDDLVLSESLLKLSKTAAELSALLVWSASHPNVTNSVTAQIASYKPSKFTSGSSSSANLNQLTTPAWVVKNNGYCYGVYHFPAKDDFVLPTSTRENQGDEKSNHRSSPENDGDDQHHHRRRRRLSEICPTEDSLEEGAQQRCCSVVAFDYDYDPIHHNMEQSLRSCAKDCVNPDECVVLTGFSYGGAAGT